MGLFGELTVDKLAVDQSVFDELTGSRVFDSAIVEMATRNKGRTVRANATSRMKKCRYVVFLSPLLADFRSSAVSL